MKRSRLEEIIVEELYKYITETDVLSSLDEKSVPEPYNRKERRRMTSAQIAHRDTIGNAMKNSKSTVKNFKKDYGEDWEYYLWAAATNKAFGGGE